MIPPNQFEVLQRRIFSTPGRAVYAVMDGAMVDGLPARLAQVAPDAMCLFEGSLDPMLSAAAPWLLHLQPGTDAARMVLAEGWNGHWGIVLETDASHDLRAVRAHLRRVLRVRAPDGTAMLFRFYDPRAFRAVVPVLEPAMRREFFGPLRGAYVEARAPDAVLYFSRDGQPEPQTLMLATVA
ncbi:DUF4123 domain-containing protein [Thermomonas flagellata]|uniref:DUF4123 domain-containing protein n=1 Tax=Thermomonas flagellata TaxID=2888524 RepID=UPI001F039AFF